MSGGRPVPFHASGGGVVEDCIMCGLPYAIHDHAKSNWLGCPDKLLAALAQISWSVQGKSRFVAPDNLRDWLLSDNRYPQHRGRNAALLLIAELWWRAASVGRNPEGEDPAERLRAEHEHAVGSEADETPKGSRP